MDVDLPIAVRMDSGRKGGDCEGDAAHIDGKARMPMVSRSSSVGARNYFRF